MTQFGNSDNLIKRLEEENQSLKHRLEEKTQQYLKVWERDFHFGILIDDVLENPELKHALKVMNIIKKGLNIPDGFKAPTINKEEVEQLTKQIDKITKEVEHLRIDKQNNEVKSFEAEKNIKNLNNEIAALRSECIQLEKMISDLKSECIKSEKMISDLKSESIKSEKLIADLKSECIKSEKLIADLQAECIKSEKELAEIKPYYEKKMTELMWKNDKLNEEKEFRKFQLKKHQENSMIVNKENDKENQTQDKVQKLLMDIARLEGKLLNKDKELKTVWEKVEFYRNQLTSNY